jgi:hypothetical protein
MVTTKAKTKFRFTVDVAQGIDGSIYVRAEREDGEKKAWSIPATKLRVYAALNGPLRDAIDFLIGKQKP